MKFDPNNQLSEAELEELGNRDFDAFLEYLDQKTEYLKRFSKPLDEYHLVRYATTTDPSKIENVDEIKKQAYSEEESQKKIEWRKKRITMLKGVVKNVKTDRRQWFD